MKDKLVELAVVVPALLYLLFWMLLPVVVMAGVLWVAIHFIGKLW